MTTTESFKTASGTDDSSSTEKRIEALSSRTANRRDKLFIARQSLKNVMDLLKYRLTADTLIDINRTMKGTISSIESLINKMTNTEEEYRRVLEELNVTGIKTKSDLDAIKDSIDFNTVVVFGKEAIKRANTQKDDEGEQIRELTVLSSQAIRQMHYALKRLEHRHNENELIQNIALAVNVCMGRPEEKSDNELLSTLKSQVENFEQNFEQNFGKVLNQGQTQESNPPSILIVN